MLSRLSHIAWPSLLLRMVLVLAVWTGPVPYCHCHGTLNDPAAQSFNWLGKHLQAYHGTDVLFADIEFGWHLHLPDPSEEEEEQSEWLAWSSGAQKVVSHCRTNRTDGLWGSLWPLMPRQTFAPATAAESRTRSFFATFAPTLPLPLRFGISRC